MNPTREQVLQWAREAGGRVMEPYDYGASPDRMIMRFEAIERFAALAYAAGLERAAEVCEEFDACDTKHIAAAIRALKGEKE